ncbi:MAG: glycine radical enzyme activase, partial [Oribacterium sp.]
SGVMLDVKAWKREEHERVTGTGNEEVLGNLRALLQCGKLYELRTVVVPGLFDYEGCIRECARMLRPYPEVRYKIIAFRKNGVRAEYRDFESPTEEEMSRLLEIAKSEGAAKVLTL